MRKSFVSIVILALILMVAISLSFTSCTGVKTAVETSEAEATAAETTAAETTAATEKSEGYKYTFYHLLWGMTDPNVKWHIANAEAYMKVNSQVKIETVGPENYDPAEHAKFMDTIMAANPDGILLHISDVDTLLPSLQAAKEKGIPVMSVTSHPPSEEDNAKLKGLVLPSWVGADESLIGGVMGKRVLEEGGFVPKHVVYTIATPGHAGHEMRAQGFFDSMPEGVKTTKLATGEEPTQFKDILRSFLVENPDVNVIFTFLMCNKWVADVVEELDMKDKIILLTADDAPSSIEGILKGYYLATFGQEFGIQGQLAYHILYLYKEAGVCPIEPIITGPLVIDESNAQLVKDQIINVLGEEYYNQESPW